MDGLARRFELARMSHALYDIGGLRFWTEEEIEFRDLITKRLETVLQDTLTKLNPAWKFVRVEGPLLAPRDRINPNYGDDDLFVTNHEAGGQPLCLSPETTDTSYTYAKWLMQRDKRYKHPPLCVWQTRKSFRRENTDGATAAKLRFNDFYQLEFQCIYKLGTKIVDGETVTFSADYKTAVLDALKLELTRFYGNTVDGGDVRIQPSDRLPSYSKETTDLEVWHKSTVSGLQMYREVASVSLRTDFGDGLEVLEVAFGLDRLVEIANINGISMGLGT